MARLIGRTGAVAGQDFVLSGNVRLGAAAESDIRIPVEGVSRRHARISREADHFWLEDTGATNGTFLNGARIHREPLHHLDVVTLGRAVDLIFLAREDEPPPAPEVDQLSDVKLEILDGAEAGTIIEVPRGEITIGRALSCNVVLNSPAVGRAHARIERSAKRLVVEDLQSANGTQVNGKTIDGTKVLSSGDIISLAGVRSVSIRFSGRSAPPLPEGATALSDSRRFNQEWKTRFVWAPEELAQIESARADAIARAKLREPEAAPRKPAAAKRPPAAAAAPPAKPAAAAAKPAVAPAAAAKPAVAPAAAAKPAVAPAAAAKPVAAPAAAAKPAVAPAAAAKPAVAPAAAAKPAVAPAAAAPPPAPAKPAAPAAAPAAKDPAREAPAAKAPPREADGAPAQSPAKPAPAAVPPDAAAPQPPVPPTPPSTAVPSAATPAEPPVAPPPVLDPTADTTRVKTDADRTVRSLSPAVRIQGIRLVGPRGSIRLGLGTFKIGRAVDADVRLEDRQVSRVHAILVVEERSIAIEDLKTVNGTLVNGREIKGRQTLKPGDTLQVGESALTVEVI